MNATSLPRVIYFDYDSFVIKPEYQTLIADHVGFIKRQSARKVTIEGHTDETGGREYNLSLGQKRAEAVVDALVILGAPKERLEAVSFGKEKPAVVGSDEAAYAKNRRAEFRYQ
jgi:peptidoglycan-associated lipoprotein